MNQSNSSIFVKKLPMKNIITFFFLSIVSVYNINAQTELDDRANITFHQGWSFITHDSTIMMNLRFRLQDRIAFYTESAKDLSISSTEWKVRRLRLRFDGFVLHERISYLFQLAFTRDDMDWDKNGFPGLVRDAMIFCRPFKNFQIGFGQGKLPGNRQRVISSGQQQFADRSISNSTFTLDRDFGIFINYSIFPGNMQMNIKTAISSGEGRNIGKGDDGFAYTGRLEWLPFGKFTKNGDYFEGDLEHEEKIKVSLAGGISYNHKAIRTSGQFGSFTESSRDLVTQFADVVIKYNGWALSSEYMKRNTPQSTFVNLIDGTPSYVYSGFGTNTQLSYCFDNQFEIAGRFTLVQPDAALYNFEPEQRQYMLGITKYLNGHPLKLQLNLIYFEEIPLNTVLEKDDGIGVLFQVELGI